MPRLINTAHEKFCQFVARGNDPVVAYIGAGYRRDPRAATALLSQPTITARVRELIPFFLEKFPDDPNTQRVESLIQTIVDAQKKTTRRAIS